MARIKESPHPNVVSMRINDEERKQLECLMKKTHKTVSDLMREAIEFFAANHNHIKQTRKDTGRCGIKSIDTKRC